MPWWFVPVATIVGVVSAWTVLMALMGLLDATRYSGEVWRRTGRSKTAWMLLQLWIPMPSTFIYWNDVRPALDRHAATAQPVPFIARSFRWEGRVADWDARMRVQPWFRMAVGAVVLAYAVAFVALAAM